MMRVLGVCMYLYMCVCVCMYVCMGKAHLNFTIQVFNCEK